MIKGPYFADEDPNKSTERRKASRLPISLKPLATKLPVVDQRDDRKRRNSTASNETTALESIIEKLSVNNIHISLGLDEKLSAPTSPNSLRRTQSGPRPDRSSSASLNEDETSLDPQQIEPFIANGIFLVHKFIAALEKTGIRAFHDPRLLAMTDALSHDASIYEVNLRKLISVDEFVCIARPSASIINQALSGELIIPDFEGFSKDIEDIFKQCKNIKHGNPASYIPQFARASNEKWAVSICTVDGQRASYGDFKTPFSMQSLCDVISYAIAVTDHGEEHIHNFVGKEPTGDGYSQLVLDRDGLPHNPMINSGALALLSLIQPERDLSDRFDYVYGVLEKLAGDKFIGFNNAIFLALKCVADKIHAVGYYLKEHNVFPPGTNLRKTIDLYLQLCSIETTTESAAVIAATLANGGICPLTAESILSPNAVRNTLSLMHSCGMYNFSGQWSFEVGLPAKSSTSGSIMIVIPDVMGIVLWSPFLDKSQNSARGVAFSKMLTQRFAFHHFDNLLHMPKCKVDPRRNMDHESKEVQVVNLLIAAQNGDMLLLFRYYEMGINFSLGDYDSTTALHLACSFGQVDLNSEDRWGNTPLDQAVKKDQAAVIELLLHYQRDVNKENIILECSHGNHGNIILECDRETNRENAIMEN